MHQGHKIEPGTECSECGTHHKILDSLPARPLAEREVDSLDEDTSIALAEPVNLMVAEVMGVEDAEWATENIVLGTSESARVVSLHEGVGWVVQMEEPLDCNCCTPREHGENFLLDSSEMLKSTIEETMDNQMADDDTLVRWAIDEYEIG